MMNNKILVTGAGGQVGMEFRSVAPRFADYDFVFLSKNELPIEKKESLDLAFQTHQPAVCINCAAYTAVDKAEEEKEKSFLINGQAVGLLAAVCLTYHTQLIHLSTDYVLDGRSTRPIAENEVPSPVNQYGASKLLGEELAAKSNPGTIIIRTSWVYSEFGQNFVKTMIRLMGQRDLINVVNDQIGSPTWAADLAEAIMKIILSGKFIPGIYHFSNSGEISWFDFALAIRDQIGSKCRISPITSEEYPTAAKRPAYSLLDKKKIMETYDIKISDWKKSLASCIGRILKQKV
ncbi:MAG: dTDP-4-dehydrorhamnose reductase [Chitinophagales bacterium]